MKALFTVMSALFGKMLILAVLGFFAYPMKSGMQIALWAEGEQMRLDSRFGLAFGGNAEVLLCHYLSQQFTATAVTTIVVTELIEYQ